MEQAIWILSDGKKEMQNFDFSFGIAWDEMEGVGVGGLYLSVEISKMFDILFILNNG